MKLITYPNPILNKISLEVVKADLPDVKESIAKMTEIMKGNNGVGLAAVQVGILKRYALLDMTKDQWKDASLPDTLLIINPIILSQEDNIRVSEGCLSLPRYNEIVSRPSSIFLSYQDESLAIKEITLQGLLAQCVVHELKHMQGELLIDNISSMKKQMWEKSLKKRGLL